MARGIASIKLLAMSKVENRPAGERLASSLGWPRDAMGLSGAAASLLDIGAPWRQIDSMLPQVARRQEESQRRVQAAMLNSIAAHLPPRSK